MNARVNPPAEGEATPVEAGVEAKETGTEARSESAAPVQPEARGEAAAPEQRKPKRRNGRRLAIMASVPLVLAVAGGYFYLTGGRYVETDNAYVQQAIVSLSPDVSGRIVDVEVHENQHVKAGAVLFKLDPEPYRIALDKAKAALAAARVSVDQLRVSYKTAQTALASAQATLDIRQREQDRVNNLVDKGVSTAAAHDDVLLATQQARAAVDTAQQQVAAAIAALGGDPDIATEDHPSVRAARAAVAAAQRDLEHTSVVAPADGIISQVDSLNVGQHVTAGSTVVSLVETGNSWVEANYKETQLAGMKVGQEADIAVDAYPGVAIRGTVAGIGAATGSEFALIPAQNATGNWVKVVQRIPVRINLEGGDLPDLRSGMSSTVSVDTGKSRLDAWK